jgi:hypothetical protein
MQHAASPIFLYTNSPAALFSGDQNAVIHCVDCCLYVACVLCCLRMCLCVEDHYPQFNAALYSIEDDIVSDKSPLLSDKRR